MLDYRKRKKAALNTKLNLIFLLQQPNQTIPNRAQMIYQNDLLCFSLIVDPNNNDPIERSPSFLSVQYVQLDDKVFLMLLKKMVNHASNIKS